MTRNLYNLNDKKKPNKILHSYKLQILRTHRIGDSHGKYKNP